MVLCKKMKNLTLLGIFGVLLAATAFGQNVQYKPQIQNDGSFSVTPKTAFTCQGRAAGYYADVQTGCQIYHMCDGIGRQFSYACPNTTLFQQRMLICDHWYMVNCSKAESNYAANLLIGQKDKPFVPEEENEIRTPRPDLLDRPYAADYNGDSYRNQYKSNTPAPQNTINAVKLVKPAVKKSTNTEIFQESASNHGLPIHWDTRFAKEDAFEGTTPIPIAAEEEEYQENKLKINERRNIKEDEVKNESRDSISIASNSSELKKRKSIEASDSNISLNRIDNIKVPSRRYEPPLLPAEAVNKTSQKPPVIRTNTQQTAARTNTPQTVTKATPPQIVTKVNAPPQVIKPNPPQVATKTNTPQTVSKTILPQTINRTNSPQIVNKTPIKPAVVVDSGFKPFESILNFGKKGNRKDYDFSNFFTRTTNFSNTLPSTTSTIGTTTTPKAIQSRSTTSTPLIASSTQNIHQAKILFRPASSLAPPVQTNEPLPSRVPISANIPIPSADILPPFPSVANFNTIASQYVSETIYTKQPITNNPSNGPVNFGISTLQGPSQQPQTNKQNTQQNNPRPFSVVPPALDILPPKEEITSYDDSTTKGPPIYYEWKWSVPSFGLLPPVDSTPEKDEDNLSRQLNPTDSIQSPDSHNQTARSISSETGNFGENNLQSKSPKLALPLHNFLELRRKLSIPDFTFPLENDGRIGYEQNEAKNSFQIKIPQKLTHEKPWYGENEKCPECHPSFVRPGTCEPCVKIRR